MRTINLSYIFFVLFISIFLILPLKAISGSPQIDTPLKAAVFYFPPPGVLRCLNHSDIPKKFRKASIYRLIKISGKKNIEQSITVGIDYSGKTKKGFLIKGNIKSKDEIVLMEINPILAFDSKSKGQKAKGLFGLEDLIGLQPKIIIMDNFYGHEINYEVFLRETKGMIGSANYKLDLFGQDKIIDGVIRYVLEGKGKIGNDEIMVQGWDTGKDSYELNEKYGPIEVSTTVKVYD